MAQIRLGVPPHLAARPLVYGLMGGTDPRVEVTFDEPGSLAEDLDRGHYDAALIPCIEYLRGAGKRIIDGPALVARPAKAPIVLVASCPLDEIRRIAVGEFCRTPVAVLRIVLAELHRATPDLMVAKDVVAWSEHYDAILLTGDDALRHRLAHLDDTSAHNIVTLWQTLTHRPLVTSVWVSSSGLVDTALTDLLVDSRNQGMQNLSALADGIARTSEFDSAALYDMLSGSWSYDLGTEEYEGLRALEELALRYDLLQRSRLEKVSA